MLSPKFVLHNISVNGTVRKRPARYLHRSSGASGDNAAGVPLNLDVEAVEKVILKISSRHDQKATPQNAL